MNRENLYRGKRKDNGEWVEGSLQKHTTIFADGEKRHDYHIVAIEVGADCYECDSDMPYETTYTQVVDEAVRYDTICEHLGSTDINKKKLFEGDIVRAFLTYKPEQECIGVIEYDTGNACYMIRTVRGSYLDFNKFYRHEVIGNKWDNPELLKTA